MMLKMVALVNSIKQKYRPPTPPTTYSKVYAGDAIHNDEDVGIGQLGEAEVESHGEHEDQELEVEVEGGPGGGLVLGHGGDDGDVVLGVGGIEEGVEAAGPGGDF